MNEPTKIRMSSKVQFLAAVASAFFASVQSVAVDWVSDPLSDSVRVQATLGNFLEGKLAQAVGALVDTAADTEMGSDIGTDVSAEMAVTVSSGTRASDGKKGAHGPKTLAEYCAGPTADEMHIDVEKGTRVMADWKEYGTKYPGVVTKKRSSGKSDILYDDGFTEKRVDAEDIEVVKTKKKTVTKEAKKPRDDPACELLEYVEQLKEKFGTLNEQMSLWLQAQRARVAKGKAPEPPPTMAAVDEEPAAPAPAAAIPASPAQGVVPSQDKVEELEKLKGQLADRDEYIKKLEKKAKENELALRKARGLPEPAPKAPGAAKTVDDLIAEYKARIAQRDEAIERLKLKIKEQEQELARLGAAQISLQEISDHVKELAEEAEKVEIKRIDLEKRGKLDDELRVIVDRIVKNVEKLERKVARLIELEQQAEERKAEAERAAAEAERRAKAEATEKAEKEGKDPEEVEKEVQKAVKAVQEKAENERKQADLETLDAAQDVESTMQDAEKHTTQLDTGLHPHGAKWWRYRYEHSYIEAVIMIFIVFLYLIWNVAVRHLKDQIFLWSLPPGHIPKSKAEEIAEESHGAMYALWLHALAEQTLVCIMVFLTVWSLAQTSLIHIPPQLLRPSKDMRVPTDGEEYRRLAMDICTIFFFAIMFYYCLMFSVAHETRALTMELEDYDRKQATAAAAAAQSATASRRGMAGAMRPASNAQEFENCRKHFITHMTSEMQKTSSPEYVEIQRLLGGDLQKFPLWHYLRLNVRLEVVELFSMSWKMWLPVVIVFAVLMCLHRYAHMGYVRIMSFFGLCLLGIILSMAWHIWGASDVIHKGVKPDSARRETIHNKVNTEGVWMVTLQFALFFLCYGVARTVCQSWMWELHFWPVLCLTILALVSALLFVWLVAPAIPGFCAVMAMPPYVDPHNIMMMRHVAQEVSEGRHGNITPR